MSYGPLWDHCGPPEPEYDSEKIEEKVCEHIDEVMPTIEDTLNEMLTAEVLYKAATQAGNTSDAAILLGLSYLAKTTATFKVSLDEFAEKFTEHYLDGYVQKVIDNGGFDEWDGYDECVIHYNPVSEDDIWDYMADMFNVDINDFYACVCEHIRVDIFDSYADINNPECLAAAEKSVTAPDGLFAYLAEQYDASEWFNAFVRW